MAIVNVTPQSVLISGQSLQSLVTANAAGSTFNFAPGIYRNQTIQTPKTGNIYAGDPGGGTIIRGSVVISGWTLAPTSGFITKGKWTSNATFTRVSPQSDVSTFPTGSLAQFGEELFMNGVRLTPSTSNPPASGSWFWNSGVITIVDDPTDNLMELAQIVNFYYGGNGIVGEVMTDLSIEQFACPANNDPYAAVRASGTYTRCTFRNNHSGGFQITDDNVSIIDCKIIGNGLSSESSGTLTSTFAGCEFAYNGAANYDQLGQGPTTKILGTVTGTTMERCCAHHNYGTGFWSDTATGSSLRNCLSWENYGPGIMWEATPPSGGSSASTLAYNVCIRNGNGNGPGGNQGYVAGLLLSNASHVTVDHCFVEVNVGCAAIILVYDTTRGDGSTSTPNTFSNNLEVFRDSASITGLWNYFSSSGAATGFAETFTGNAYIVPATGQSHWTWWDTTKITFATWKASHSFDTSGSSETAAAWPQAVVLQTPFQNATITNSGALINTTNAPCCLYGGLSGQTFDPGAFPWPAHVWLGKGTNSLIIRLGVGAGTGLLGVMVHDWTNGGGTNSLYLLGYTFASQAAAVSAFATSGANAVLTLTDGNTVTFVDAATSAFTTANVFIVLPAVANQPRTPTYLLTSNFQDGQATGSITPGDIRELVVSVRNQGLGPPSGGTWPAGFEITNLSPEVLGPVGSQYVIRGWMCVVAGTPGVWVQELTYTGS